MFQSLDFNHTSSFNSDTSCKLISTINDAIDSRAQRDASTPHKPVFAPSSAFCDRKIWFRFRGVNPDTPTSADYYGEFVKMIGDACHVYIQSLLKETLKDDWIDVADYLADLFFNDKLQYRYTAEREGLETHISIHTPPICFSTDGIIRYRNKLYIIEIKSLEHSTFSEIFEPRAKDVSQTVSYQSLLYIEDVMYIYVDRLYGNIKCFEYHNGDISCDRVFEHCNTLMRMANAKVAPSKCNIPSACNMCEYRKQCKEW